MLFFDCDVSMFADVVSRCCNTCDDVREAYRKKGWAFSNALQIEQCQREGWASKIQEHKDEGCRVYGYLEVNKVIISCLWLLGG